MPVFLISALPEATVIKAHMAVELEDPSLDVEDSFRYLHTTLSNLVGGWEGGKTIAGGNIDGERLVLEGPEAIRVSDPLEFGNFSGMRISIIQGNLWITSNALHDGSNWTREDISLASFAIEMQRIGTTPKLNFHSSSPGPNPIVWKSMWSTSADKKVRIGGSEISLDNDQIIFCRVVHAIVSTELHSGVMTNLDSEASNVDDNSQASWFAGAVGDTFQVKRADVGGSTTLETLLRVSPDQLDVRQRSLRMGPLDYALVDPSVGSIVLVMDKNDETDEAVLLFRVLGGVKWRLGSSAEIAGSPNDMHISHGSGAAGSETYVDVFVIKHGTKEIHLGETSQAKVLPNGVITFANLVDDASADPSGDGSMYYNTTTNTFRRKRAGSWENA